MSVFNIKSGFAEVLGRILVKIWGYFACQQQLVELE